METILITRKGFFRVSGSAAMMILGSAFLTDGKDKFKIDDMSSNESELLPLKEDEIEILHLASLAPSGHNTQPWFVKYIKPFHYIIGNDKTRWLPAVDPDQRETILSIGAFIQNFEYAANQMGYESKLHILANKNQDEYIAEIKLIPTNHAKGFDTHTIRHRRTLRSNFLNVELRKEDINSLVNAEPKFVHFISNTTKEHLWLCEQTIEANRKQSSRDDAQRELADWIRFSNEDSKEHNDGLTMASMEIGGITGWILRHFYGKANVMKKDFREKNIEKVKEQVSQSAGWFLISSKDNEVKSLLEAGKRLERMLLKIREMKIAIHPMTQILEEQSIHQKLNKAIGIPDQIQFILRVGYVKDYPQPVSLRRKVESFVML